MRKNLPAFAILGLTMAALPVAGSAEDAPVTRFSVVVEPDSGETRFVVQDGELAVTSGGKTETVGKGLSVRTNSGAVPKVTRGLGAPGLVSPANGGAVADATGQLTWNAVKGARGYQVQVAKDRAFRNRIATLSVEATGVVLPPSLPKGVYYWRVASVSADGSEGLNSVTRSFRITREPGKGDQWTWGPIWDPWGRPGR